MCVVIIQISTKILAIILDLMHHIETTAGLYELESVQLRQPHEVVLGNHRGVGVVHHPIFGFKQHPYFDV